MHPEIRAASGQRFDALRHGGYAEAILLPGDNAAAFRRQRRALFQSYRPQTQDEFDLVDALAGHRWMSHRFRLVQAQFDGQAVTPATDGTGRICEPIAYRRLHSGMDVTVQRQRIENLRHRTRVQLVLMQKLRRQRLIERAEALPQDCYMETDGRVLGPVDPKVIVPIPKPDIEADGRTYTLLRMGKTENIRNRRKHAGKRCRWVLPGCHPHPPGSRKVNRKLSSCLRWRGKGRCRGGGTPAIPQCRRGCDERSHEGPAAAPDPGGRRQQCRA